MQTWLGSISTSSSSRCLPALCGRGCGRWFGLLDRKCAQQIAFAPLTVPLAFGPQQQKREEQPKHLLHPIQFVFAALFFSRSPSYSPYLSLFIVVLSFFSSLWWIPAALPAPVRGIVDSAYRCLSFGRQLKKKKSKLEYPHFLRWFFEIPSHILAACLRYPCLICASSLARIPFAHPLAHLFRRCPFNNFCPFLYALYVPSSSVAALKYCASCESCECPFAQVLSSIISGGYVSKAFNSQTCEQNSFLFLFWHRAQCNASLRLLPLMAPL